MINWEVSDEDNKLIKLITKRAKDLKIGESSIKVYMDITAAHNHNGGLRLKDWLESDEMNFCHDLYGIIANINRKTGVLENNFVPRFSLPAEITGKGE